MIKVYIHSYFRFNTICTYSFYYVEIHQEETKQHAVNEYSCNKEAIRQPVPWNSVWDVPSDIGSDGNSSSDEQEDNPSYGHVEEFRVKMHQDWESSLGDGRIYFVGYKGDFYMMYYQQSQVTTGLQRITQVDREPDIIPRVQHKNQPPERNLKNSDEASIHKNEWSIAQGTSPKSQHAKMVPDIGEGQQQRQ